MRFVSQGNYADCCQHACIAMVCDVSLDEVIAVVGHTQRLSSHEKVAAMEHFGTKFVDIGLRVALYGDGGDFKNIGQLSRAHDTLWCSVFSFVDVNYGHAVLVHKMEMYDPYHGINPSWPWHRMIGFVTPVDAKEREK